MGLHVFPCCLFHKANIKFSLTCTLGLLFQDSQSGSDLIAEILHLLTLVGGAWVSHQYYGRLNILGKHTQGLGVFTDFPHRVDLDAAFVRDKDLHVSVSSVAGSFGSHKEGISVEFRLDSSISQHAIICAKMF